MGKCNWCGNQTQKYESDFYGTSHAPFCSYKCEVEYNKAVEEGNIPPPSKPIAVWQIILVVMGVLFIIAKCQS